MTRPAAGIRQLRRDEVTARILQIGRDHLTQQGAAALSLRAVTRELGMVSSAVYRYVANRDELLTLLLVDAYTELGNAVDGAVDKAAKRPWSERIVLVARAVRDWARHEPARYALLYGSPVPGYRAPPERTNEPGTRVIRALVALIAEGVADGDIVDGPGIVPLPSRLRTDLAGVVAELDVRMDPAVLARGVMLWSVIFGAVNLEVFGQYGADTFARPDLLFDHQVRTAVVALQAKAPPPS